VEWGTTSGEHNLAEIYNTCTQNAYMPPLNNILCVESINLLHFGQKKHDDRIHTLKIVKTFDEYFFSFNVPQE